MLAAVLLLQLQLPAERHVHTPFEMPAASEQWVRVVTPRFDIVSSAGERRTRDLARDLETLAAALADIQPKAVRPPAARVFLFTKRSEVQPFFDLLHDREKSDVSGTFVAQNDRAVLFIDESRGIMRDRTPYHELVHYLLGSAPQRPPLWVEEGLAEYYSNAEVHGGIIRVGARIREHMELLKHRLALPVAELFNITGGTDASLSQIFYAESWAIVDWMIDRDRKAFDAFLADVSAGMSSEAALQKHFKRTKEDLQRIITSGATSSLPDLATTLQVRVPEIAADAVPMSRADILYEFGSFLLRFEASRPDAERYLRAAIELNPKHARAYAALGDFDRAIAVDPNDGEVLLEYAEKLLGKEIGAFTETHELDPSDLPQFRRARELAQKALTLGADRARALGAIGASYIIEDDPSPAIAPLESALAITPNRNDYALHLLSTYRRLGDSAKADPLYARLIGLHDKNVDLAARAVIVRTEVARINAMVKAGKLDEAAAALRAMSANTPDANARRQMDDQAKQLEANAGANREILAYNLAVEKYNQRDLKGAQTILDELLKTVADPQVKADATKLQSLIRERLKHR